MSMERKTPYSYHTFLYPFLWDNGGQIKRKTFIKALPKGWKHDPVLTELVTSSDGKKTQVYSREGYSIYQYFNEAARRALFPQPETESKKQPVVECLLYEPLFHEGTYNIYKRSDEKDAQEPNWILNINAIRLKIFNTGVAVMVFELKYMTDSTTVKALNDVMMINEYGRRLFPPYLPREGADSLCADKIVIRGKDLVIEDNFKGRIEHEADEEDYTINPNLMPNLIKQLLGEKVTDQRETKKKIFIEPAIDDRMFVCCCVSDGNCVDRFLGYRTYVEDEDKEAVDTAKIRRQEGKWAYLEDWALGQELYALMNIDAGAGSSSCASRKDLDMYLEEQLYTRWIEYGTLYGVTNHSLICLTGDGDIQAVVDTVITPFLTEYTQMAILILAQRASLISFEKEISKLAASDSRLIFGRKRRKRLVQQQKCFAIFQGEILLAEVTAQIQGIEIYEKLKKFLFITEMKGNIESQTDNLFEIEEAIQRDCLSFIGLFLSAIGVILTVTSVFLAIINFLKK